MQETEQFRCEGDPRRIDLLVSRISLMLLSLDKKHGIVGGSRYKVSKKEPYAN